MSKNVPWDVAFSLDPVKRLALVVYYGELEGGDWDFDGMRWRPQK